MSNDFSVLIKVREKSLGEVRSHLERILGVKMTRASLLSDESYVTKLLGVGVTLYGTVTYDDDIIQYSNYDFEIGFDYKGEFDRRFSDGFRETLSIVIGDMVARSCNCECIALRNLDVVLGRFFGEGEPLYTLSSDN